MGFSGTFLFGPTGWAKHDPDVGYSNVEPPYLVLDIMDSDYTEVIYGPTGPGTGFAYLGFTPRVFFDDPSASPPTDVDRESAGLAEWWGVVHGVTDAAARAAKATEVGAFLAPDDYSPDEDDIDVADDDPFVEVKTARFVRALGLPLPDDLARLEPL